MIDRMLAATFTGMMDAVEEAAAGNSGER